jgi:hypothetical protein
VRERRDDDERGLCDGGSGGCVAAVIIGGVGEASDTHTLSNNGSGWRGW